MVETILLFHPFGEIQLWYHGACLVFTSYRHTCGRVSISRLGIPATSCRNQRRAIASSLWKAWSAVYGSFCLPHYRCLVVSLNFCISYNRQSLSVCCEACNTYSGLLCLCNFFMAFRRGKDIVRVTGQQSGLSWRTEVTFWHLQNTTEQIILFVFSLFCLNASLTTPQLALIPASVSPWISGQVLFLLSYSRKSDCSWIRIWIDDIYKYCMSCIC